MGENLVRLVTEEGAKVYITDINQEHQNSIAQKYGAEIVSLDGIYDLKMDIYAPCALGATLNTANIKKLKCKVIAGAANNQMAEEGIHGQMVSDKGILYAPDFLINAGGLINVYSELKGYDRAEALEQAKKIYDTTLEIFKLAKEEDDPGRSGKEDCRYSYRGSPLCWCIINSKKISFSLNNNVLTIIKY